jgi:transposase
MERASGDMALKVHLSELMHIRQIIAELNRAIRALATTECYRNNVRILKTVPGVSTLTAMTLLTELYDINRFKTLDKLCGYVGLIPNTDSSGEMDRKTGITGRRNAHLRRIVIESAWTAVRKDPALMMVFNELYKHMTKTKAIVRIARKLLNRIRYVLRNQREYIPAIIQ